MQARPQFGRRTATNGYESIIVTAYAQKQLIDLHHVDSATAKCRPQRKRDTSYDQAAARCRATRQRRHYLHGGWQAACTGECSVQIWSVHKPTAAYVHAASRQVSVVAAIMEVNQKSTNTVYKLDDGTATIEAMVWNSGDETEQQMRKKEQLT